MIFSFYKTSYMIIMEYILLEVLIAWYGLERFFLLLDLQVIWIHVKLMDAPNGYVSCRFIIFY